MNILLGFDNTSITIDELLAKERSSMTEGDVARVSYDDCRVSPSGELVRIYHSQPVYIMREGEELTLDRVKVKIADFGKGHLDSRTSSHN
jgi:hypothetical protein